jgi:protein TonB
VLDVPRGSSRAPSVVAGAATVLVHAGLVVFATWIGARVAHRAAAPAAVTEMYEVELAPQPPEPPPVPEAQPAPEPEPEPVKTKAPRVARPEPAPREAPPPAAAQAGQVLEAKPDVVDFGDTFVTGNAAKYAGGTTERGGTATHAVQDTRARAGGVEGGTGTHLLGDLSRAPVLAGGATWSCPFPAEADDAGLDHATVALRVEVGADGSVVSARSTSDPGYGFAREAKRCALSKRWAAGLDRAGKPIRAVALVNVRFDR